MLGWTLITCCFTDGNVNFPSIQLVKLNLYACFVYTYCVGINSSFPYLHHASSSLVPRPSVTVGLGTRLCITMHHHYIAPSPSSYTLCKKCVTPPTPMSKGYTISLTSSCFLDVIIHLHYTNQLQITGTQHHWGHQYHYTCNIWIATTGS